MALQHLSERKITRCKAQDDARSGGVASSVQFSGVASARPCKRACAPHSCDSNPSASVFCAKNACSTELEAEVDWEQACARIPEEWSFNLGLADVDIRAEDGTAMKVRRAACSSSLARCLL